MCVSKIDSKTRFEINSDSQDEDIMAMYALSDILCRNHENDDSMKRIVFDAEQRISRVKGACAWHCRV